MKLKIMVLVFLFSVPLLSQNHYYFGITHNSINFNVNGLDGKTYIYAPGKHIVWPMPNLSSGNAFGLTLGVKNGKYPNIILFLNYSRSMHKTNWFGPDFYDLQFSKIESEAKFNVWNIDFRFSFPKKSFLQLYIQPGCNFSSLHIKKGSANYVEILGEIFADNYDAEHSFWGVNCNLGFNLNLSRNILFDTGFLIKYMLIDIEDIKNIKGFATGYIFELMYVL